jgi:hypothetical protein
MPPVTTPVLHSSSPAASVHALDHPYASDTAAPGGLRQGLASVVAAGALLCAAAASAQPPACSAPARPDSGRVCLTLTIEDGVFALNERPTIVRGTLPDSVTNEDIVASLTAALASAGFPYRRGLTDETDETADEVVALQTKTADWETYVGDAADAGIDVDSMMANVSGLLGDLRRSSGFVTVDDPNDVFNTETGAAQLDVVVFTRNADIRVAGIADATRRASALRSHLQPLVGQLWVSQAVIARVNDYYAYLGLTPTVEADPRERRVEVVEGTRVQEVRLPPLGTEEGQADARTRMKALYALLDDRDFRRWLREKPPGDAVGYVRDLGREAGSEPYFFPTRAQMQQLLLSESGLVLQPIPAATRTLDGFTVLQQYVGLGVIRPSPDAGVAPPPAAASADEQGLVNPNRAVAEQTSARGPDAVQDREAPTRERNNYVGGGISYSPGQGVTLLALYQRRRFQFPLRDSSLGVRVARTGDNLVSPSINYFADYVFFERLRRRVSLQLNLASDAVNNRLLDGQQEDVRRKGGLARVEVEPFRDRGGRLLRLHLEAARHTVTRTQPGGTDLATNLTTADLSVLFIREQFQSLRPWRASVQPLVRWAPGAGGEPAFVRFQGTGDFHVQLSRGFELDFSGNLHAASVRTPLFEQPSLGGPDSVRGFRSDAAIGRTMWSAQSELWTPVPSRARPGDSAGDFLRRVVRLAFFADVGGLAQAAPGSDVGTRAGTGAGLRLKFDPVLLRLDYAYGFGRLTAGQGRHRAYFSVRTNLPF